MLKFSEAMLVGKGLMSARRMFVAGAAALGLYSFGGDSLSYLSTAGHMVSEEVGSRIPIQFELERARTMIDSLVPDIKRNMIVIAKEEVNVATIKQEVEAESIALEKQRDLLIKLRHEVADENHRVLIASRVATQEEVKDELGRLFERFKLAEATLGAKRDLLSSRMNSLAAARKKLDSILNAKRDLDVQTENLQARLRSVQSESMATNVNFDESQVAKCQKLVDELQMRLNVTERLLSTTGNIEDFATSFTFADEDVIDEIDSYLKTSSPSDKSTLGN